ncbi:hypothetical protein A2899_02520 [Candidatus Amesbacteria bacterium RIFCSPLOWO2_01_FULL_49_25]|uniref:Septum formation initiator n=1 Tax=Candidatus Amesbacteria bacterium RIFCSPHIGHO2_01_FULL_48_32b TaxID=1797253 RepID=A0A1F4YET4_9BACT|nr:MAG: hypothetical protein A2876_04250 [Candidatus Amesbacteria bacterium RIFCSPHIGHO2_01_FULL_48_32b]OGD08608.1 MAG: hypothetical protein A2899_02520 [Candidatus Amesbacteria bacterium RIFCSPLOWO2_01_FULL_49_25]
MRRIRDWIIIGLGVVMTVRLGSNVWRLYKAGDRVGETEAELAQALVEQAELKKQLEYVQTDEFVEREAREKLGLGKPGEVVVILPTPAELPSAKTSEGRQANWRKWWELYVRI